MTKRLYLNNSYLRACTAQVTACTKTAGGYFIELDQSVFFPTGGGQPHDTGTINGNAVLDTTEDGERVNHLLCVPLTVGETVSCEIDWARRFDYMQQHSGEHVLSFAIHVLYGAKNVGFHMADTYCTVDFDMPFAPEQLIEIERRTNALVFANSPVTLQTVDAQEVESLPLRKAAKGLTAGSVRIVYMQEGDSCTCCGTHVNATGEIGFVKITAAENYKGGMRLWFACGARAVAHAQSMQSIADTLARAYSCKPIEVQEAVAKIQRELSDCKRDNRSLYTRLHGYIAAGLRAAASTQKGVDLIAGMVDLPPAQLRPLALLLTKGKKTLAFLCARDGETLSYVLCATEGMGLDMGELAPAVNAALNARGGGRSTLAQGSGKHTGGTQEAIDQLANYLAQRLRAR